MQAARRAGLTVKRARPGGGPRAGPSRWLLWPIRPPRLACWPASLRLKAERRNDHGTQSRSTAAPAGWCIHLAGHAVPELLQTGEFADLIDNYGLTGATSNPTIFAKAITDSDRYDGQLRELVAGGERDTRELFFSLALDDIRAAARLLSPAYEHSQGDDGFKYTNQL